MKSDYVDIIRMIEASLNVKVEQLACLSGKADERVKRISDLREQIAQMERALEKIKILADNDSEDVPLGALVEAIREGRKTVSCGLSTVDCGKAVVA